jgi:chemotaxis protein CheX
MRADDLNCFVRGLTHAFRTMLSCEVRRGRIFLRGQDAVPCCISGVIGLSGKARGVVALGLSREVALRATSRMLNSYVTEIDDTVSDVVRELASIIAGQAKAELPQYDFSLSLPNVISGQDHAVSFPAKMPPVCVPFSSEWGPLALEVGLAPVGKAR